MDHATNWLLVQTHEMRDQSSIEFEKRNSKFYKDHRSARFLELHMLEALKMASGVGLATILVIGALLVESNDMMSVAMFITLVKVYQRVGKKTIHFCRSAIKITRGLSALRRVIDAINLPLGIGHYMDPWPDADDLASVDPQRQHGHPTPTPNPTPKPKPRPKPKPKPITYPSPGRRCGMSARPAATCPRRAT